MLNRDNPKAKEDGSSSVGGEEMAMVTFSGKFGDDEEEGMQPLKLHFPSSLYQKSLKLLGKCYIDTALRNIQTILKKKEVDWFIEHPQFQHFFHIKNQKHMWIGMWLLVLRSACIAKKYELWFIVNCVLAMKSKPHQDRLKMAVLYFLASILAGGRKSGEEVSPVDSFFLTVVNDLDACLKLPWGRYAFEHNFKDVSSFLEKCDGVVLTSWIFTSFHVSLEAIPSLRNHFQETVNDARSGCSRMCKMQYKCKGGSKSYNLNAMNMKLGETKEKLRYYLAHDIKSVLVVIADEKGLLKSIGMDKESCWVDDLDDAAVDRWTKIIHKGKKQIFFEEQFSIDVTSRTAPVEGPTILAIGGPSNNAESGQAHAYWVEAPRVEALKELEGWLMNAIRDVLKEVNQKFNSLGNRLTPLEKEVKYLRKSSEQDGGDTPLEQDGGDTPLDKDKDGGFMDVSVFDIAKQMQSEHSKGNDDMAETAEMCAAAEKLESQMSENDVAKIDETRKESGDVQTEMKKKNREIKGDGKEVRPSKKANGCDNRNLIWTRRQKKKKEATEKRTEGAQKKSGKKKQKEKAAEKEEASEKRTVGAQKKGGEKKQKKNKKGGKKKV
ncbi:hypothetical protein N665_0302s0006 [Sinapis alba]|nr:hypothetical protein N665_0302s0006 [Sinapis alba]